MIYRSCHRMQYFFFFLFLCFSFIVIIFVDSFACCSSGSRLDVSFMNPTRFLLLHQWYCTKSWHYDSIKHFFINDMQLLLWVELICIYHVYFYWQYPEIWALDEKDPFVPPEGGESAADVASRLATALATIEAEFQGYSCTAFL